MKMLKFKKHITYSKHQKNYILTNIVWIFNIFRFKTHFRNLLNFKRIRKHYTPLHSTTKTNHGETQEQGPYGVVV